MIRIPYQYKASEVEKAEETIHRNLFRENAGASGCSTHQMTIPRDAIRVMSTAFFCLKRFGDLPELMKNNWNQSSVDSGFDL